MTQPPDSGDPNGEDRKQPPPPATPPPAATPPGEFTPPAAHEAPPPASHSQPPASTPPGRDIPPPGGWPDEHAHRSAYDVMDAFGYGWRMFVKHLGAIAIGMLAILGAWILVYGVGITIMVGVVAAWEWSDVFPGQGEFGPVSEMAALSGLFSIWALINLILSVVGIVISAGIVRASLDVTRGESVRVNRIFSLEQFWQIVIAAIVLPLLTSLGFAMLIVPGLVFVFYSMFTIHFIVGMHQSAIDGLVSSCKLVHANLANVVGFFVLALVVNFAGALALGIGLLVSLPVTIIAASYTFRVLQGDDVAR